MLQKGLRSSDKVELIESRKSSEKNMMTRRAFTWRGVCAAAAIAGGAAFASAGCSTGGSGADATGNSGSNQGSANGSAQNTSTQNACSVTGSDEEIVITMPPTSEPAAGFDPFVSWGCGEHVHEPLIQSTLITTNAQMGFENDLATSYNCSEDGLTWTFQIRKDASFTNGTPVRAQDVAFTINGIKNSEQAECDLTYVEAASATAEHTCEIKLKKPFNALLYTLATVGIVPAAAHGSDYGSNPVGSGRYMLEQWDAGQQVILKANPSYYGAPPQIKRVIVLFMEEAPSLAAARAAQVDVAFTSATYATQSVAGYDLQNFASADSRGVSLPCVTAGAAKQYRGRDYAAGNAVTSSVEIRRAINMATNRQQIIDNVLNGYGQVAWSVSANMPWDSADMQCEYSPDAARELLDAAGWVLSSGGADGASNGAGSGDSGSGATNSGSGNIREKDGVRAAFDLYYAASDSTRQAMANEFAAQMRQIGIEVNIKGRSWSEIYEHQFSDAVLWGWGTNSPLETYNIMYSSGVCNYACYENAAIDAHLNDALSRTNVEESYADYKLAAWDGSTGVAPSGAASWVWFANVDHLYFTALGLNVAAQKPHPHGHGWSLLNNVDKWHW